MSKKIISVILALMLLASTAVMAAVSASAAEGEYYDPKPYVASDAVDAVGTFRYFFLLPNDWKNDWTQSAGVYWWDGTDPCGSLDGAQAGVKWPGYQIYQFSPEEVTMYANNDPSTGEALVTGTVWYVDVPQDVTVIIFSNALDGGDSSWDNFDQERYEKAYQTTNISVEGIWPEDGNPNYPGPEKVEDNSNMIYIIDPSQTSESVTGKKTFVGDWYFYHGGDMWDTQLDPKYGGAAGELPGDPVTDVPTDPNGDPDEPTTAPTTGSDNEKPEPSQGATSAVSTKDQTEPTTLAGNGTIATGSLSLAVIVLIIAAAATSVVIVLRKKEFEK